jgi:hypothetical protein
MEYLAVRDVVRLPPTCRNLYLASLGCFISSFTLVLFELLI